MERAHALLRIKREFRVARDLEHPSVVHLYELDQDEDGLFFTMEVVEGVDLRTYCRPNNELDLRRLANVVPQVLEALDALHSRGIVHCDLKPSNVLVRADGVVKLVDFGVLAELGRRDGVAELTRGGSAGYLAPEVILGERRTPAVDLYSLGAVLFELAAGRRVFLGSCEAVLQQHLNSTPALLGELSAGLPARFVEVCNRLLAKKPTQRPTMLQLTEELLPALGARRVCIATTSSNRTVALVGRQVELRQLDEHLADGLTAGFGLVVVAGPTGIGKSVLVERTMRKYEIQGGVVLRGRGRLDELVLFNAFDGIMDDVAATLRVTEVEQLGEAARYRVVAASAFPVLGASNDDSEDEPSRQAVFAAVAGLISWLGARGRGLAVFVDDLQWADADSLALLDYLVQRKPEGVVVFATLRNDVDENEATTR